MSLSLSLSLSLKIQRHFFSKIGSVSSSSSHPPPTPPSPNLPTPVPRNHHCRSIVAAGVSHHHDALPQLTDTDRTHPSPLSHVATFLFMSHRRCRPAGCLNSCSLLAFRSTYFEPVLELTGNAARDNKRN
ncbi:hypothetical protein RHSIM_Rhsim13G0143900 [Rhododendron simsii]|uniref:Uncharacterized protein n=1 Tax=Rhododendron simsii TaxID=118357 RepID=A0A834L7T6_RHOSS|nr:hypothetical protein RHSIM_Rhsim13G0143900 [Rhododendron simsii]